LNTDLLKLKPVDGRDGGSVNFIIYSNKGIEKARMRFGSSISFANFLASNDVTIKNGYIESYVLTSEGLIHKDKFKRILEFVESKTSKMIDTEYFDGLPSISTRKMQNAVYMVESGKVYYYFKFSENEISFNRDFKSWSIYFGHKYTFCPINRWHQIEVLLNENGKFIPLSSPSQKSKEKVIGKYPDSILDTQLYEFDKIVMNHLG